MHFLISSHVSTNYSCSDVLLLIIVLVLTFVLTIILIFIFTLLFIGADNVLCVNSKPITIAGVNRHEFDPTHGRAVSIETMRKDAMLMKQFNFNATRCSHYPQHRLWLEICDEAGLYVVDEANIETHGFQVTEIKKIG